MKVRHLFDRLEGMEDFELMISIDAKKLPCECKLCSDFAKTFDVLGVLDIGHSDKTVTLDIGGK